MSSNYLASSVCSFVLGQAVARNGRRSGWANVMSRNALAPDLQNIVPTIRPRLRCIHLPTGSYLRRMWELEYSAVDP